MFVQIDGFSYWATRELTPSEQKIFSPSEDAFSGPAIVMTLGLLVSILSSIIYFFGVVLIGDMPVLLILTAIGGIIIMALGQLIITLEQIRLANAKEDGTLIDIRSMPLWRLMIVRERFASRFNMDEVMNGNEDLVNEFLEDPEVRNAMEDFEGTVEYAEKRNFLAIIDSIAHECCIEMTVNGQSLHDQPHHTRNK